ncbi:MAG: UvrD-helicase domain-containing protein, partial [Verrucomicrobia bacterium]|nr:UvrD-helicase domain-containing protein [Cytophagales bacterium]
MKQFKIYNSSAGSGKTYTLTKEYLKLALATDDSSAFRRILAITFTNDAANEMKTRILDTLGYFADDMTVPLDKKKGVHQLLSQLTEEINLYNQQQPNPQKPVNETVIRNRAARTFSRIIHEYSDFAVSTIDSFTNRIVSAFTEELELPFNYEVSLDIADFMHNAVDRLIDRVGETELEKLLTETLEAYMLERADEGGNVQYLPTEITKFALNTLGEKAADAVKKLQLLDLQDFTDIRKQLEMYFVELKEQIVVHAKLHHESLLNQQLSPQHLAGGEYGIWGFFEGFIDDFEKEMFKVPSPTFLKNIEKDDWSGSKAGKNEKLKVSNLKAALLQGYLALEALRQEFLLFTAINANLYKISVLNEIEKELKVLKVEKNMVHIGDFNKKIINIVLNEPVPFIYERMGEKYNHILIDEFQDTSALQWNNLLPLVENSLGKGNFNLLVGDAKQAIYGWRGGDMKQLVNLTQSRFEELINKFPQQETSFLEERYYTLSQHIVAENLSTNFRSKKEIIDFNNDFFSTIIEIYQDEKPMLADVYNTFQQQYPAKLKTGGHVQICFIDSQHPIVMEVEKTTFGNEKSFLEDLDNSLPFEEE